METSSNLLKPWYRRLSFRISLRGLILLVLIVGGGLGYIVRQAKVQRDAVAAIENAGGYAVYGWESQTSGQGITVNPWWPGWLVNLVGIDYLDHVTQVGGATLPGAKGLGDEEVAAIGRLDRLESLDLGGSPASIASLVHLRGNVHLKQLYLSLDPITPGNALAHVAGLTQLEEFTVFGYRLKDDDLAHLSRLTRLRNLSLHCRAWPEVTEAGLAHLEPLTNLESLHLACFSVNDAGLAHLRSLHNLKELVLDGSRGVTNKGLAHLGELKNLEKLILPSTAVTDLASIQDLDQLQQLWLQQAPIGDAGLAPLARFKRLKDLSLTDNAVMTDAGLAHLRGNTSLTVLNLIGTQVTDAGLVHLVECPNLEHLELNNTQISDAGLASIARLKSLTYLDVRGTHCTPEKVRELPRCTYRGESGPLPLTVITD